jgi:hypothetical protein
VRHHRRVTAWLNATGGLRYHLRAWRYRRTLWAPFVRAVSRWLGDWRPAERSLVLVGPSGGYCIDLQFIRRFDNVTVVELDPIARWIFARRARGPLDGARTRLAFDSSDYLSPIDGRFSLEGLRALCERYPSHAVLFCNVLGQLPLLGPDPDEDNTRVDFVGGFEWWLRALPEALADRSWASFHDRLSGAVRPSRVLDEGAVAWRSSEALVEALYPQTDRDEDVLNDHRTSELAVDRARVEMLWEIVPSVFHLVEAVCSTPGDRGSGR